ncbi:MAG TPA: 8-amino-7-oxononanoate synthase [Flavipsychrobacter sp.]|nr:8-amino-7-oxononanoate synthase [Flavipsychrobacter sp.]
MDPVEQYIERKLQERIAAGNLRTLKTERTAVDFFSNDYLGIATNNILQVGNKTTGSTGSRLLSGNAKETEELEYTIAKHHGAEAALIFNSGYDANTGLLSSIADRHTTILYDELCHASIIDGIKLSHSPRQYKFAHNDVAELEKKLDRHKDTATIVVVESVYSMDGDMAPLKEIASLTQKYGASLVVDEAHTTGVFGKKGEGVVGELGLQDKILARMHTFGKALGCHGAAIVGSEKLKQFLVNFARPFIYTTALPPHNIEAVRKAYEYLDSESFSSAELHDLIHYFRDKIKKGKGEWKDCNSPIQVLILGSNEKAKKASELLQSKGLQVNAILHPTVPMGSERLRVCLHTFNTKEQIDLLFNTINKLV